MDRHLNRTISATAAAALLALGVSAGAIAQSDDAQASPMASALPGDGDLPMASEMPMGEEMMGDEMPMDEGMMEDPGALGEPADPADADRTVTLTADDTLKFDPAAVDVTVGETVTFEIQNLGAADHEFVLGSEAFQAEHEAAMASDAEMEMEEPNEVEIPAGTTASLTWHFTEPGQTRFGCHVPGHYVVGMFGTITVSEPA